MEKVVNLIDNHKKKSDKPFVSFEFFPPRTNDGKHFGVYSIGMKNLSEPLFFDFTWGAGGSTAGATLELCSEAWNKCHVPTCMHITCTNVKLEQLKESLDNAKKQGIKNIMALRGDPPRGEEAWSHTDSNLTCALDMVKYIRSTYGDEFGISVAGYPEGHPTAIDKIDDDYELSETEKKRLIVLKEGRFVCKDENFKKELQYLKEKVDAGADLIITQMVLDAETFFSFERQCRDIGIKCPIIPGIICIQNYPAFDRMTSFSKTRIPEDFKEKMLAVKDDDKAVRRVTVDYLVELCSVFIQNHVDGLHFFTLNLEKVLIKTLFRLNLIQVDKMTSDISSSLTNEDWAIMKGTILDKSYDGGEGKDKK